MAQPIVLDLKPQRRQFAELSEVLSVFPNLHLPRPLPVGVKLTFANWQYPPKVVHQRANGKIVGTEVQDDVPPSLLRGHVQLVFTPDASYFVIDQGQFAAFGLGNNKQLGVPQTLSLPGGRAAFTRVFSSAATGNTEVRVVGWAERAFNLTIWSTKADLQELVNLAASTS